MYQKVKVLITMMTYPSPSSKYTETVCTGGILEGGGFIRLYPIGYRYLEYWQQFHKYQWVEVAVMRNPRDKRPESYRADMKTIRPLGPKISTKAGWQARKEIVLSQPIHSMCELRDTPPTTKSLALIRPREVQDVIIKPVPREWNARIEARMQQLSLDGFERKALEKIPYKFTYSFLCEAPRCKGHKMAVIDWEVGQLFRNCRDSSANEDVAVSKVRDALLTKCCGPTKDTHFFVGTIHRFGTWIIVGIFYPPK